MRHEKWEDYTEEEINSTKQKKCKNCKYATLGSRQKADSVLWYTCDYYITTGYRRIIRPEDCQHHKD